MYLRCSLKYLSRSLAVQQRLRSLKRGVHYEQGKWDHLPTVHQVCTILTLHSRIKAISRLSTQLWEWHAYTGSLNCITQSRALNTLQDSTEHIVAVAHGSSPAISHGNLRSGAKLTCHLTTFPSLHTGPSNNNPPANATGHMDTFWVYLIWNIRKNIPRKLVYTSYAM